MCPPFDDAAALASFQNSKPLGFTNVGLEAAIFGRLIPQTKANPLGKVQLIREIVVDLGRETTKSLFRQPSF